MLVHELMSRDVTTFRAETPIVEAARILLDGDITAAPVVYENGALVGIVSRRDLIRGREIEDPRAHLAPVHDTEGERPHVVRQVMSTDVVTVRPDDDTARAATLMLDQGLASLPVVSQHRVVGMISVTDILRAHTHTDEEIAEALRERFFEYGESRPLGAVTVEDGYVTITDAENHLTAVIAEAVAETTEGVVGVRSHEPSS
jgi:CBS-domain-containing membrane protein